MTKAEMVLKVVMSPIENVRTFVEQFRKLLPDSDLQDFQRVLEMKVRPRCIRSMILAPLVVMLSYLLFLLWQGIRGKEQSHYIELFRSFSAASSRNINSALS